MSGIAGLASLIGGAVNFGTSVYNNAQAESMLAYQNWYNSPEQQMKRGIAAGINPNALAQGIAGSPGYGNMAAADASSLPGLSNDLGYAIGNSVNSALNADLIKSNIKKNEETTRGQKIQNDYEEATFDTRVQQALDEGAITASEAQNARYLAEKYPDMVDLGIEEQRANIDKIRSEKTKIDKEVDRIDQEIKESNKRIEKLEQDIKTSKSQEALNYANAQLAREKAENQRLLNDKQEMENRREELTGSATGTTAAYFDIEKREGKEAADNWLEESNKVVGKVIENSSESSARGQQNVVDETPQGQLKKRYQDAMNKEIQEHQNNIAKLKSDLANAYSSSRKRDIEAGIKAEEKAIERVERKYGRKMRRVDKGASGGASLFGFGANYGS